MGKINDFFIRHPFIRGIVSYSITWPAANFVHQRNNEKIDYWQAVRYGAVGVTFVLPVYFVWLRTINRLIPAQDFKTIVKKVVMEQTLYWPVAISVFFAGMNFYEGQSFEHFKQELKEKYVKTHSTGLMFWPFVAPIVNYSTLVKDHNRVPIAAAASFLWASFLSFVKDLEVKGGK